MKIFGRLALAAPVVYAASLLLSDPAQAHGNFDQSLEGDPGCNTSNFGASVTAASGQHQSFVPTGSQLISVALCVSAANSNTPLIVAIYQGGTLIGGGSTASNVQFPDAAGPPVRYVHVDFLQPYAVTPGATYVIENVSDVPVTWYGTAAGSPYSYCLGAPNTSAVGDFGFQSFLADSPGTSAACPEPPPTQTPVPTPTNTPAAHTSTPAAGATTEPTNTPAPNQTAANATLPSGNTADGGGTPASSGTTGAGTRGGAASAGSQPNGLPGSGSGFGRSPKSGRAPWLLATAGVLLVAIGGALCVRSATRGRL